MMGAAVVGTGVGAPEVLIQGRKCAVCMSCLASEHVDRAFVVVVSTQGQPDDMVTGLDLSQVCRGSSIVSSIDQDTGSEGR